ncbi:MAG: hypothetical protein OXU35_06800 [Acidobacteriota bacterium]|nr:hypothetical protein [Acidobacteriota bacterium]
MRTTVIGGFVTLLVAGGVWIAYEATSPTASTPSTAMDAGQMQTRPLPEDPALQTSVDTDRGSCEPWAMAEVMIAATEARVPTFLADMRTGGVPEHVIAARQAQAGTMFERTRSETWRPGLTPEACLEFYERAMAHAIELGLITPMNAAQATEDFKGRQETESERQ